MSVGYSKKMAYQKKKHSDFHRRGEKVHRKQKENKGYITAREAEIMNR